MKIKRLPRDFYSKIQRYVITRDDGTELKVGCSSLGEDVAGEPIEWKVTEITEFDPNNPDNPKSLYIETEFDDPRNPSRISYWVYYNGSRRATPYRQIATDCNGNIIQDIYTEQEMTRKLITDDQGNKTWVPYFDFIDDKQPCPKNRMTDPELGKKLVDLNGVLVPALNEYEKALSEFENMQFESMPKNYDGKGYTCVLRNKEGIRS